jgi:hypothetical protein
MQPADPRRGYPPGLQCMELGLLHKLLGCWLASSRICAQTLSSSLRMQVPFKHGPFTLSFDVSSAYAQPLIKLFLKSIEVILLRRLNRLPAWLALHNVLRTLHPSSRHVSLLVCGSCEVLGHNSDQAWNATCVWWLCSWGQRIAGCNRCAMFLACIAPGGNCDISPCP